MQRKNRKINKLTGDPSIDSWIEQRNDIIRDSRNKAPMLMSESEQRVIRELLPTKGVARIITTSKGSAQYVKNRMRRFIKDLGPHYSEMIATSVQDSSLIIWRIAKYGAWRINTPLESNQIYQDAQADDVTVIHEHSKAVRDDSKDTEALQELANKMDAKAPKEDMINIYTDKMTEILNNNLKDGIITEEQYNDTIKRMRGV